MHGATEYLCATMIETLYFLGIRAYDLLIWLLRPFHKKAALLWKGRRTTWAALEKFAKTNSRPTIWMHCASLGEFEQGRPLLEALHAQYANYALVLTFFSPSGYEVRKSYPLASLVAYLPSDSPRNAKRFCRLLQPSVAIFVKYEFWHYYLAALQHRGAHILSVSTIFNEKHPITKPQHYFYRAMMHRFDHFFVQNVFSAELLRSMGIERCTLSGDTRFDRVLTVATQRQPIAKAVAFTQGVFTLVMGSVWEEDLKQVGEVLDACAFPVRILLAPHEIDEASLRKTMAYFPQKKAVRFSDYMPEQPTEAEVLLIDNIGMLSSLYQYADVAYVGGAFGKGLHNILEAAVYGVPVLFGTNYYKFQEAVDLIAAEGAFSVADASSFSAIFTRFAQDDELRKTAGARAGAYVRAKQGATDTIMNYIGKQMQLS